MRQTMVNRTPEGELYYGTLLDPDEKLHGAGFKRERDGSIYAGEWNAGLRQGRGAAFERSGFVCAGMWEGGQPAGPRVLLSPADKRYLVFIGTLQGDDPQEGITFFPDGRISYGIFTKWNGEKFDGEGALRLRDKRIYAGRWENGRTATGGVMRRANGRITGNLQNPRSGYTVKIWQEPDAERFLFYGKAHDGDARNAAGINFYSNQEVYAGTLRDGRRQGKAVFQAADGTIQIGEWKNGTQQGAGIWIQSLGDELVVYFGEFLEGCFHGKGIQMRYHEHVWSVSYCGTWENGKKNGIGLCSLDSGEFFHGSFRGGAMTGLGEIILKDGTHKIIGQKAAAPVEKAKPDPVTQADEGKDTSKAAGISAEAPKNALKSGAREVPAAKTGWIHGRKIEKDKGEYWGPRRQVYTDGDVVDGPVFNSVSDHPVMGDERHFVRIAEKRPGASFRSEIILEAGKQYEVLIYFRNNAFSPYNSKEFHYKSVARDTRLAAMFPSRLSAGEQRLVLAKIAASNAVPGEIWDHVAVSAKEKISVSYVTGSAKIYNNWNPSGQSLSSERLFSNEGALIGLRELNGIILGGKTYAGYAVYTLQTRGA